jgi:drug/metabolite transporter (DMT)-like permease
MTEFVRLYAQIALLRRGPQDVPASPALLAATVVGYVIVNFAVSAVLPPVSGPWVQILLVDVAFTIAWYAVLLRVIGKPERFLQTTTAVFGYQAILSPLTIASGWLIRHFHDDAAWQSPLWLIYLIVIVWMIAVNSHVLKAALEWSTPSCVALVILQIITAQLLLLSLFPAAAR